MEELRSQRRCVTPADYVEAAQRHPEVRQAAAHQGWTGSGHLVVLHAARRGGMPVDAAFCRRLASFLHPLRLLGAELEIRAAAYVSIFLSLEVTLEPGYAWTAVRRKLADALGSGTLDDGSRGFFHPDNFSFGEPLYLSQVLARAGAVPGVARLTARAFQPWRREGRTEAQGCIAMRERPSPHGGTSLRPRPHPRLQNDPARPQYGLLRLHLKGGAE